MHISKDRRSLSVLVVFHKQYRQIKHHNLVPIQVNHKKSKIKLNMLGDDYGDNISDKNDNYCELTAMYWAWKNLLGVKYLGLYHYRRYLVDFEVRNGKYSLPNLKKKIFRTLLPKYVQESILIKKMLNNLELLDNVVYVPQKLVLHYSIVAHYEDCHIIGDYFTTRTVISELYPEYLGSFDRISESNSLYPCNMFVMGKDRFDTYCEWLFTILFEVERRITISEDALQKRVFGFLSERLFNVYLDKNSDTLEIREKKMLFLK